MYVIAAYVTAVFGMPVFAEEACVYRVRNCGVCEFSNRVGSVHVPCSKLQRVRDVTAACADTVNEGAARASSVIGAKGVRVQCT